MPREILDSSLAPEDPAIEQRSQRRYINRYKKRPKGRRSEAMEHALEKINFDILEQLFFKRVSRCGISKKDMNFLGKERMIGVPSGFYGGSYGTEANVIFLAEEDDDQESEKEILEEYGGKELYLLKRLIHEQCHSISKNILIDRYISRRGRKTNSGFYIEQSGYFRKGNGQQTWHEKEIFDTFHALNEGVVERLAREITLEYLEISKWPNAEAAVFRETVKYNPEKLAYSEEVRLVDAMVRHLSAKTGQTEALVWESFVRGLIEGETFEKESVEELFEQAFGKQFLMDLSNISALFFEGNREKMQKLMQNHGLDQH